MMGDAGRYDASGGRGATQEHQRGVRSIAGVLTDTAGETLLMIRQELALLRAELREKISRTGDGATALGAGLVIAVSGWLVLITAGVLGLATIVPPWLAALIVGFLMSAIGALLLRIGVRRSDRSLLMPHRTPRSELRGGEEARLRERLR